MEIIRARQPAAPSQLRTTTFTGTVYADPVFNTGDVVVANVIFTPGARTFWHHHERGQIIYVTAGSGLICAEGGQPQLLQVGDTVWVPPGERHWHGGGPENVLVHLAVSLGTTSWFDAVTDEEYRSR